MHNDTVQYYGKPDRCNQETDFIMFDFTNLTYHGKRLSQHLFLFYEMIPYNI